VPYYRFHMKAAALAGSYVINDPFWWSADEKFFGYSLASKLGVKVPRTVMLPSHSYIPSIDPNRSLRNLEYPLDWEAITSYVGFPAILKPADGGGWKNVSRVNNMAELFKEYNKSEQEVLDGCWSLNHALGYDMNSVEFACKDGVPYAIDFTNPAPDMDIHSILPKHFHIVVDQMAKFAIQVAREGRQGFAGYPFRQYLDKPKPRPAGWCEIAPAAAKKVG
jgi:hypothetical protein